MGMFLLRFSRVGDTATLTGGYNPGGTITFTLIRPDGTTITVGTVPVTGAGTYSAPTVLATQVGTYSWHASYTGDGLNNGAIDDGTNESVTTIKATCPGCGEVELTPDDIELRVCTHAPASYYVFDCPMCHTPIQKPADDRVIQLLISGGVKALPDYAAHPGAIPLPATLTYELSRRLSQSSESGVQVPVPKSSTDRPNPRACNSAMRGP